MHLITTLQVGGAERFVAQLAEEQADKGDEVRIAPEHNCIEVPLPTGVSVLSLRHSDRATRLESIKSLRDLHRRFLPDIIHCHSHHLFAYAAFLFSTPMCYTVHTTRPDYWNSGKPASVVYRLLVRSALSRQDRCMVLLSERSRVLAMETFHRTASLFVISNGIKIPSRGRGYAAVGADPIILWIGRLADPKDPFTAVRAAAALKRRGVRFKLLICGDGPHRTSVALLAETLELSDVVEFLGQVSDPWPLYRAAELVWMTTGASGEGHSLVMLEAMALGKPLVVTNVLGIVDHLDERSGATIVEPRQPEALAEATIPYLDKAAASRPTWLDAERYSISATQRNYQQLYSSLIECRRHV